MNIHIVSKARHNKQFKYGVGIHRLVDAKFDDFQLQDACDVAARDLFPTVYLVVPNLKLASVAINACHALGKDFEFTA